MNEKKPLSHFILAKKKGDVIIIQVAVDNHCQSNGVNGDYFVVGRLIINDKPQTFSFKVLKLFQ